MGRRLNGGFKYGATAAGALALGATGAAAADQLLTGGDIKDGSLEVKDLSKKARKALKGQVGPPGPPGTGGSPGAPGTPGADGADGVDGVDGTDGVDGAAAPGGSLLVSAVTVAVPGAPALVAPGTDRAHTDGDTLTSQVQVPPYPTSGVRIRGLAVRSSAGTKGPGIDPVTVTLRSGALTDTALSCTTSGGGAATAGTCSDTDNIVFLPGSTYQLVVDNNNASNTPALVTISLSLEPA